MISLITVMANEPIVQIVLYLFASLASLLYLITIKPFDVDLMLKAEILNEIGILMVSYTLFWFTDYVVDPSLEFDLGWCIVGMILLLVLINMVIFGIALVRKTKLSIKKCMNSRSHKKQLLQKKKSNSSLVKSRQDSNLVDAKVKSLGIPVGAANQVDP